MDAKRKIKSSRFIYCGCKSIFLLNLLVKINMLSTGRLIFTIAFIIAFVALMIYAYRKDLKVNRMYFPKSYRIILGILLIFSILFLIVKFKHLIMN